MREFEKIDHLNSLKSYLKEPNNALVIFDVDYVLTQPKNPAFHFSNFPEHKEFIQNTFLNLTPLQRDIFANLMVFDQNGSLLIDQETPGVIKELQNYGAKTIALTAALSGEFEGMDLKHKRFEMLKAQGIDFSSTYQELEDITFNNLKPNRGAYPLFYKGILFSNGENQLKQKGATLKAFLSQINEKPKTIIMVDDRAPNLVDIELAATQMNIKCCCYQFTGFLNSPKTKINKEVFEESWKELSKKAIELSHETLDLREG